MTPWITKPVPFNIGQGAAAAAAGEVTYPDSCGTNADGTASGAFVTSGGKFDNALSFDGVADYVACNGLALPGTCGMNGTGTISVWADFDDLGLNGGTAMWAFGDADGNTFIELGYANDGSLHAQARETIGSTIKYWRCHTASGMITTSGTYHCVLTQDGIEPKLYVNAVESTTFSIPSTDKTKWVGDFAGLDEFRLGQQYHSGVIDGRFTGLLSDIGIYDKDIGSSLISDLYNSGTGAKVSSISTDGCIAYYQPTALIGSTLTNNASPV
jgi:hypothetical protein